MPESPSEKQISDLHNRTPPANVDAEKAVLGVMISYGDVVAFALDSLGAEYFYGFGHDKIFQAIKQLYERAETVNVDTVAYEMKKNNWLEEIGGRRYLTDIAIDAISFVGRRFSELVDIIAKLGMKRRLIVPLALAINQCYELDKTPNEIIDNAQQAFYETLRLQSTGDPVSLRTIFKNEIEFIESVAQGEKLPGILTGFTKLDLHLGSMFPGDLVIIAGVPGSGKTVFSTQMALNAATMYGKKVLYISMEMYEKKYAPRLIASQAGVPHRIARLRNYRGENIKYLNAILEMANGITENYFAHMQGPLTAIEVKTKAKKHAIVNGLDILFVDHLHEMKKVSERANDYEHLSMSTAFMKEIGMELKIPVVLMSQLSRELNYRQDPRPRMSDLRGSGNIEAKADVVAMIFRPGMYNGTDSTDMELGLEKYRDDEKKIFKFRMNGNFMKYEEANEPASTGTATASDGYQPDPF